MAIEKWLAITSTALFGMFSGEMISIYYFMGNVPQAFEFGLSFVADPKIFQFISIGVAPAGILAAVPFIMTKRYGSKTIGRLIILGGVILLLGMLVCYSMLDTMDPVFITDIVQYSPVLFIIMSFPVMGFGAYLTKLKPIRPKKDYF
jgi:vacuolar-type H+-ATPase subunit I/STV1